MYGYDVGADRDVGLLLQHTCNTGDRTIFCSPHNNITYLRDFLSEIQCHKNNAQAILYVRNATAIRLVVGTYVHLL